MRIHIYIYIYIYIYTHTHTPYNIQHLSQEMYACEKSRPRGLGKHLRLDNPHLGLIHPLD